MEPRAEAAEAEEGAWGARAARMLKQSTRRTRVERRLGSRFIFCSFRREIYVPSPFS
jgi:hypothetical protein